MISFLSPSPGSTTNQSKLTRKTQKASVLSPFFSAVSLIHSPKSGGLRLKRDITEYGEFVRSFNAPSIDEKFELLGIMANVFVVAPESLSTLFEGTPSIRKDAQRFILLREDYKSAKLASRLSSLWAGSS